MTTEIVCRCGARIDVKPAGRSGNVLWLVKAPNSAEGFARDQVAEAHRLHECPSCKRLVYVGEPGVARTLARDL